MKRLIKKLNVLILFIFLSCKVKDDINNSTDIKLNLIRDKRYVDLSKTLYDFAFKDTILLNRISLILKEEDLIRKTDTLNDFFVVTISLKSKSGRYNEIFSDNFLTFYYNRNNINYCKVQISSITPYEVNFSESEVDSILNNYK
jgi:hypothetical protein